MNLSSQRLTNQNSTGFTVVNGQIFTPGLAVVDAPQPFTPLGGDFLQVAIDVSGSGRLPWPPVNDTRTPTFFRNITLFLTSYETGHNFTISNATNATGTLPDIDILNQEPGSTVKHVNWLWPLCLVGNGQRSSGKDARGSYNISIHQQYRMNGSEYYTIFDLPISVTNSIPQNSSHPGDKPYPAPTADNSDGGGRIACDRLENKVMDWNTMMNSTRYPQVQPYIGGPVQLGSYGNPNSPGGGVIGKSRAAKDRPAVFVQAIVLLVIFGLTSQLL
ncbi:hypothetical protein BT63DRAFT_453639 [Microthyrium microscopicum]|uniref:Uncharacterized protein n=1 Tax=Microthyrium microscopicum TaxID=703497 RepID=A0A6A6UI59_9PEZI|nr:hypothetical protein BT63DRAFT_453639 [Microthyrium microscopicum]